MNEFRNSLRQLLEQAKAQRNLEEILAKLLGFSDQQLTFVVKPVLESLERFGQSDGKMSEEDREHLSWLAGLIGTLNNLIGSGVMSYRVLQRLVSDHQSLVGAAAYLAESFRGSHQVLGALALVVRSKRIRLEHDLAGEAIRWRENVGEPVLSVSVGELQRQCPFLAPVIFCSRADLSQPELYRQYFGGQSGLRSFKPPEVSRLFELACTNQPIQDCYALSPLPVWRADSRGEDLWFERYTWLEQKQELARLRRKFPKVTIRFATLPELMFLDLSMRLATAESPFGIWSFRCEHPEKPDDCLSYGHVDDYGAEIKIDEKPDREMRVMPLFILRAEKKAEK